LVENGFYVFHYTGSEIFNNEFHKLYVKLNGFMIDKITEYLDKEKQMIGK